RAPRPWDGRPPLARRGPVGEPGGSPAMTPRVLRRRDQQPRWNLHLADTPGFVRGRCNDMDGTAFSAGLVIVPLGQRSPLHSESGEPIIYALEGEVEFTVDGEPFPLEPGDLLFNPSPARYVYANVGRSTATMLAMFGRVDEWPPKGTYYE